MLIFLKKFKRNLIFLIFIFSILFVLFGDLANLYYFFVNIENGFNLIIFFLLFVTFSIVLKVIENFELNNLFNIVFLPLIFLSLYSFLYTNRFSMSNSNRIIWLIGYIILFNLQIKFYELNNSLKNKNNDFIKLKNDYIAIKEKIEQRSKIETAKEIGLKCILGVFCKYFYSYDGKQVKSFLLESERSETSAISKLPGSVLTVYKTGRCFEIWNEKERELLDIKEERRSGLIPYLLIRSEKNALHIEYADVDDVIAFLLFHHDPLIKALIKDRRLFSIISSYLNSLNNYYMYKDTNWVENMISCLDYYLNIITSRNFLIKKL